MDAIAFDKSKLPSRHVTVGPERAPHRSCYYAMGLSEDEINQPFVGVVSCWNEAAPCNIALMRQAQAAVGGPIAPVEDGDMISIDAENGVLDLEVDDAEMERRRVGWKKRQKDYTSGVLWKYAQLVGPAKDGAVTHPGGGEEIVCYADI